MSPDLHIEAGLIIRPPSTTPIPADHDPIAADDCGLWRRRLGPLFLALPAGYELGYLGGAHLAQEISCGLSVISTPSGAQIALYGLYNLFCGDI